MFAVLLFWGAASKWKINSVTRKSSYVNARGIPPIAWQAPALLFCLGGGGYLCPSQEAPQSQPGRYLSPSQSRLGLGYPFQPGLGHPCLGLGYPSPGSGIPPLERTLDQRPGKEPGTGVPTSECELTDTCENIIFPILWMQAVTILIEKNFNALEINEPCSA